MISLQSLVLRIACLSTTLIHVTVASSQAAGTETLVGLVGKNFILLGADSSVSQSISLTASNLDKIAPLLHPIPPSNSPLEQQTIVAAAAGDAADSDRLVGKLQAQGTIQEYQAGWGCDVEYVHLNSSSKTKTITEPGLTVKAMAHLARGEIAGALRSRSPYKVCLLIAGMMPTMAISSPQGAAHMGFVGERVQQQVQRATSSFGDVEMNSSRVAEMESDLQSPTPAGAVLQPQLYWLDEMGSLQNVHYGAHGHASNFCLSILDQGFRNGMGIEEATELMKDCFQQLRTRYVINSPQPPCIKCIDANGVRLIR